MTPLQIEILFHYNSRAVDYRDGDFSAPAVRASIAWFRDVVGMLDNDPDDNDKTYRLSRKGQFYVEYICSIPLPVMAFEIPTDKRLKDM